MKDYKQNEGLYAKKKSDTYCWFQISMNDSKGM